MIFDEGQHLYVKVGVKRVAAAAATTTDVVVPELNLLVLKHNLFCSAAKE